jgi:hypothetical protein
MAKRLPIATALLSGTSVLLLTALLGAEQEKGKAPAAAQVSKDAPKHVAGPGEPVPPAGQTYIGVTKCSSCHFDKFQDWKKQQDKHAKAFDILPAAYQTDPNCLKCHTTGFGQPSGFHKAADRQFAGVTCESCHGPGSKHEELSKPFATKKKPLPPEEEKIARDSIYMMLPENVCVTCHSARAHQKHPEYAKK